MFRCIKRFFTWLKQCFTRKAPIQAPKPNTSCLQDMMKAEGITLTSTPLPDPITLTWAQSNMMLNVPRVTKSTPDGSVVVSSTAANDGSKPSKEPTPASSDESRGEHSSTYTTSDINAMVRGSHKLSPSMLSQSYSHSDHKQHTASITAVYGDIPRVCVTVEPGSDLYLPNTLKGGK